MNLVDAIRVRDRRTGAVFQERVLGDVGVRGLYPPPGAPSGAWAALARAALTRPWVSRLAGAWQSAPWSRRQIEGFVAGYGIDLSEFEPARVEEYRTFNDFFVRAFRPGLRPFPQDPETLGAPAEARYLALARTERESIFPVKGYPLRLAELLGGEAVAAPFVGGPLWLARLCPVDYHRFHFPADGRWASLARHAGPLDSVNPAALRAVPGVLFRNERQVSLLETSRFGRLAYVEVGAMMVGRIVQSARPGDEFRGGDEKGRFLFGASTVILLAEPGRVVVSPDLLKSSAEGLETLVRLGEPIGHAVQI